MANVAASRHYNRMNNQPVKRKGTGCRLFSLIFIEIIVVFGGYSFLQYNNYKSFAAQKTAVIADKVFEVKNGDSVNDVAKRLISEGYIKGSSVFTYPTYKIYLKLNDVNQASVHAGNYQIPADSTLQNVFNFLKPEACDTVRVTLLEGQRVEEFAAELQKSFGAKSKSAFSSSDFIRIARNYEKPSNVTLGFNPPKNLEGFLFPDTYEFCSETSTQAVINKLVDNFNSKVYLPLKSQFDKNDLNLVDAINLASIVEREGRQIESKRNIADIFIKRLDQGIALGSDVTTMYGNGYSTKSKTWWVSGVELDNIIEDDAPYNTRTRTGLPPSPISNPGLDSIKATLDPIKNDYIFFLVGLDNKMYYSKDLRGHNYNVCKYLTMTCR